MFTQKPIEIWGGIEGTINRVGNNYIDQSEFSGHYNREDDIDLIASLGIKMLRYPILWEKHQPEKDQEINWAFAEKNLLRLKELKVEPIAGLVHHGSGPKHVNFFDGSFEEGVAAYAKLVAKRFPWLEYYTPVNEPLTTARFCGLYGHWYPHENNAYSFYRILLSECKATVMAMKAIREINPEAKLIQTEDIGKVYSTPLLKYQADFENERRWLSYELITGTLTPEKQMWGFLLGVGIKEHELSYFLENNCKPHVAGFNYYITSERYLDEGLQKYPQHVHGGNGRHQYADVEVVRVPYPDETGPLVLLREAWERLGLPIAITECHLHCTREEQMRWFNEMWENLNHLKEEGVDIRALTAWAIFGTYGWNMLVTKPWGDYESGVFNLNSGKPRPTAMSRMIQVLAKHQVYYHPVLETAGWWKQEKRIIYPDHRVFNIKRRKPLPKCQPVLIIGKSGMLGTGFSKICEERNIHHLWLDGSELNLDNPEPIEQIIEELNPWAIINTEEFAEIDQAEQKPDECFELNFKLPSLLAEVCKKYSVKMLTFSSGFVFDGSKTSSYLESDLVNPVNVYGQSKAKAEASITEQNPQALIIRIGSCFSCWETSGFVAAILSRLKEGHLVTAANDVSFSPTYIPDLVHQSLNLLLDNECGIVHVTNQGQTTYADFARKIAELAGFNTGLIKGVPAAKLHQKAKRPLNTALQSEKGVKLPVFESALRHYLDVIDYVYLPEKIAV
ncbi:family 1 glycosylhydrolase [Mucilaginibacter arboris]|uniref:dTDP-4-dehydrorhamnose reductase n=1 Tax=Mucilaginibacter arboris TaxID=2682090 RepID=A0A7K1SYQ5_9SPHI|nr:family 1 glycosylhydrolase [Mucilaginibacter arboris]MVN22442.1 sugar nucleotide-binding protein [Mucilaginibacter arboris]